MDLIISDNSAVRMPEEFGRGLNLGLRGSADYAYGDAAEQFDEALLIPKSEWQARIKEMEERKSRISDQIRFAKLPPKNQEQTNYCWGNAPVHCTEIVRMQQGEKMVLLSPASVCAKINGFKNDGGWGKEALERIISDGITPVTLWPANAINRSYDTVTSTAMALKYRVTEWTELQPRNINQLVSMLLRRVPVAVGYNWWSHEVTACDPVWLDGDIAVRIRNSWGQWGDGNGFAVLQGNRMLPDDAVCPRVALAT